MTVTINGSGTITGVTTMGTTVVNQTLTTPTITSTMGVGNATPSTSGAGITFPASQSASSDANTLDDYEEGSWTPALKFGSNNVGMTGTFTGRYTKIGNQVTVIAYLAVSNKGSSTGSAQVFNLPFVVASNGAQPFAAGAIYIAGGSIPLSAGTFIQPNLDGGQIDMNFCTTLTGSDGNLNQSSFANAGSFWISATYLTS